MIALTELDDPAIHALQERAAADYAAFKSRGLRLNMARGKPALEQLDLAERLLESPGRGGYMAQDGTDCRNYGGIEGLSEARARLCAHLLVAAGVERGRLTTSGEGGQHPRYAPGSPLVSHNDRIVLDLYKTS